MKRFKNYAANRRRFRVGFAALVWVLTWALPSQAQNYPLAVGTQWTLHLRQEVGPGVHFSEADTALAKGNVLETTVVSRVASTEALKGVMHARVESRRNGKLWLEEWFRMTPQGLLMAKTVDHSTGEETEMIPPQQILSSTLLAGETWGWKQSTAPVSSQTTVGPLQEVSVPAGSYKAVPVEIDMTFVTEGQPLKVLQKRWFVAGVGYVKQETRAEVAGHLLMRTVLTLEKFEAASN